MALRDAVVKVLFGDEAPVKVLRGRWLEWAGQPLCAGYHPLAARRRPDLFPLLVDDFRAAAERISSS